MTEAVGIRPVLTEGIEHHPTATAQGASGHQIVLAADFFDRHRRDGGGREDAPPLQRAVAGDGAIDAGDAPGVRLGDAGHVARLVSTLA